MEPADPWARRRRLFQATLHHAIARARAARREFALLFIDLDRIAQVNDMLGWQLGDRVLAEAAARIAGTLGPRTRPARVGADEFAAIRHVEDFAAAARLAASVIERCREPYRLDCVAIKVTASVGIALYPSDAQTAERLMERAERSLYRAKIAGRDCFYPGGTTCCGGTGPPPRTARG